MRPPCGCGHTHGTHEHARRGSDCGLCRCPRYATATRLERRRLSMSAAAGLAVLVAAACLIPSWQAAAWLAACAGIGLAAVAWLSEPVDWSQR